MASFQKFHGRNERSEYFWLINIVRLLPGGWTISLARQAP